MMEFQEQTIIMPHFAYVIYTDLRVPAGFQVVVNYNGDTSNELVVLGAPKAFRK